MLIWDTQVDPPADFAEAWEKTIRASAHSHFAMELPFLRWEAAHDRHALAVIADDGQGPLAAVARREGHALISGWPWRWQVARVGDVDATLPGLESTDAARVERLLSDAAEGARIRVHLPLAPEGAAGVKAGATIVRPLQDIDGKPPKKMSGNKRREMRKAQEAGWVVETATTHEAFRRFAELQIQTESRRSESAGGPPPEAPAPGESWREWEHPWMWLLVAKKDGEIQAGSGFGCSPRGMLDYRTNASTPEAKKASVNVLLAGEALRLGRDAGNTFMNWGGTTTFKRGLGGETIDTWEWLGGGGMWGAANAIESLWKKARSDAAAGVRSLQQRGRGKR